MSILQAVTAIFRSPDAAVMAAQAVQASELAARQGVASIQRDAERQADQVSPANTLGESVGVDERRERGGEAPQRSRRPPKKALKPDEDPFSPPRSRLDILA
jgi:hypothetical protein